MPTYRYFGPIIRYNIVQVHNWKAETKAVSIAKAISNIKYKAKEYLGLAPSAKVEILNYRVEEVEDLDMEDLEEIKKPPREYDPDYDIPDEAEEIYGSNIFAKDSSEVKVATSDEHAGGYPNYFGYMHIEHPNLGDFYVSFSIKDHNVRIDGYPWKFLQEPKYKLNKEQQEWVINHKKELSKISRKVSGTIKLEDNFCTLNPGIVKLKRASKKFNQRDRKFRDERVSDVKPKKNEIKPEFISRFMKETKNEYPDFKQRLAVAYDYWERYKRVKDRSFWDVKRVKDWMPSKTPLDYITEELDNAGIEYEVFDDMYGFNAPFDTVITILDTNDVDRADEIICNIVGYAYEVVRDRNGNKRDFKIVTDEELIDEFNQ